MTCVLVLPESYEELQRTFSNGEIDLAWFGGYTFVNCHRCCGAIPLVSRDRDLRFTSYFLVRANTPGDEINDFRGKRLAFGSPLSTSGHLMPRHFLNSWGINPVEFFSEIRFTGAHDKTAFAVRDGDVEIGVANGNTIDALFQEGKVSAKDVRVLKETPPYLDYVWACQADLPEKFRSRIRDAFLQLTTADPAHADILSGLRAEYFVPVDANAFLELERIIDSTQRSGGSE